MTTDDLWHFLQPWVTARANGYGDGDGYGNGYGGGYGDGSNH